MNVMTDSDTGIVDWIRKSEYLALEQEKDKLITRVDSLRSQLDKVTGRVDQFQITLMEDVRDGAIDIDTAQRYADVLGIELRKEISGIATVTFEFTVMAPPTYDINDLDFTIDTTLESTDNDVEVIDSSIEGVEVSEY